jgi:ABC-type antimicrobial peptide transport system permease subunit
MLQKLSIRNAKRSAKDYAIYLMTMAAFAGLMFAFHSLLFSPDLQAMGRSSMELSMVLGVMLGMADFFILLIIAWLIHYMVRFMLEKRSREFASYMLFGMEKKQIAKLFVRENLIMGIVSFALGLLIGLFLQQIILTMYYGIVGREYTFRLILDGNCLLLTAGCFFACYLLALGRVRKSFRKSTIIGLMGMERQNQEIREKGNRAKQWFFWIAAAYIIFYSIVLLRGGFQSYTIALLSLVLIFAIYLLYYGLAAFLSQYIRDKRNGIFHGSNLFLLRQFSTKIKTMQFTMGTLTILFSVAIFGCGVSGFFIDYMSGQLVEDYPFDVLIHSDDWEEDFEEETDRISSIVPILSKHRYLIYENGTTEMNHYFYTHLGLFGDGYKLPDGSPDQEKIAQKAYEYYDYDTYMGLSDYNRLREMLGEIPVELGQTEYFIQLTPRVYEDLDDSTNPPQLVIQGVTCQFAGYQTIAFEQDGHNGADYLIVVPDVALSGMRPFYAQIAYDVEGEGQVGIELALRGGTSGMMTAIADSLQQVDPPIRRAYGTRQVITYMNDLLSKADVIFQLKSYLVAMVFPLLYIALIYVCVAFTILSMQQLSDSNKYRFRYQVLGKLGMGEGEMDKLIFRQLFWFCLIPLIAAAVVGGVIVLILSRWFLLYSGLSRSAFSYFAVPFLVILAVFLLYFGAAYRMFCRNVREAK